MKDRPAMRVVGNPAITLPENLHRLSVAIDQVLKDPAAAQPRTRGASVASPALAVLLAAGVLAPISAVEAATITVNTLSGAVVLDANCSLPEAIIASNRNAQYAGCPAGESSATAVDIIDFSVEGIIPLATGAAMVVSGDLQIDGGPRLNGLPAITVDGQDNQQIIYQVRGSLHIFDLGFANGSSAYGGAIRSAADLTIEGCHFSANYAGLSGGALVNHYSSTLTVRTSDFVANESAQGGALFLLGDSLIEDSSFSGNTGGNGIFTTLGPTLVRRSSFWDNQSVNGAALLHLNSNAPTLARFENVSIYRNVAPAAIQDLRFGYLDLDHVTIFGNTVTNAQLLISNPASTLHNSIVAHAQGAGTDVSGQFDASYSLIESNAGPGMRYGAGIISDDPQLGLLADNGGGTLTLLPEPGSPVIDAGSFALSMITEDQRGLARPQGPAVDIGAVEIAEEFPLDPLIFGDGFEE